MKEIDKIKKHMKRDTESSRRVVFGRASQQFPWYSLYRPTNVIIIAGFISSLIMFYPMYDIFKGFQRGFRLDRERAKFNRQLDDEENPSK